MTLLVDIGNSRIKWAQWRAGLGPVSARSYETADFATQLDQWFADLPEVERVLLANVAGARLNTALSDWFKANRGVEIECAISEPRRGSLINGYASSGQLGVDRWLMMLAVWAQDESPYCVIGCGTAITVDLVDAQGRHQGGLIMPGLRTMQAGLIERAAGIPAGSGRLVELADNTGDAVYSGCLQLAGAGLAELLVRYRARFGRNLRCILSGGDGELLRDNMNSDCEYRDNLVLKGLGVVAGD